MTEPLEIQPPSLARLDAEVERLKIRRDSRPAPVAVVSVADAIPDALAAIARMEEKHRAFRESIRPQFESAPQTVSCEAHPLASRSIAFEETMLRSFQRAAFTPAYAPCPECHTAHSRAAQRRFWARRGVPERVLEATLSNFTADSPEKSEALRQVCAWNKSNGVFLVLLGTTGTGKGHLAAGCLKAQGNGRFITHPDLLSDLRASYSLHTTESVLDDLQEAEMLVLDEFGLSPGGKDEEPFLYQVLAHRYDRRKPTIITTNLEAAKLREAIGYRLLDRIQEDCVSVGCWWASYRTGK